MDSNNYDENSTTMGETASRVSNYLDGASFPADKGAIISAASQRGAPEDVLNTLENLPDRTYDNLSQVVDEVKAMEVEMA